mmetsp:Transcript_44101/g.111154  ORF Transcript_44101/g.111154 Transcript_44101/m.111154 type:complete len:345 (-) Transcript_44101:141-1175(-)
MRVCLRMLSRKRSGRPYCHVSSKRWSALRSTSTTLGLALRASTNGSDKLLGSDRIHASTSSYLAMFSGPMSVNLRFSYLLLMPETTSVTGWPLSAREPKWAISTPACRSSRRMVSRPTCPRAPMMPIFRALVRAWMAWGDTVLGADPSLTTRVPLGGGPNMSNGMSSTDVTEMLLPCGRSSSSTLNSLSFRRKPYFTQSRPIRRSKSVAMLILGMTRLLLSSSPPVVLMNMSLNGCTSLASALAAMSALMFSSCPCADSPKLVMTGTRPSFNEARTGKDFTRVTFPTRPYVSWSIISASNTPPVMGCASTPASTSAATSLAFSCANTMRTTSSTVGVVTRIPSR